MKYLARIGKGNAAHSPTALRERGERGKQIMMTIQSAIRRYNFEVLIENGQEMLKAQTRITSTTSDDVVFLKANKQAIIAQIKQNKIDEAHELAERKRLRGYDSSVSEMKISTRNDAGEWVDASTIINPAPEPKIWNGTQHNVKEVKEMLKAWDTPEMKEKAREAAAHHDAVHGDNSSNYDDD
jgi:hypothetical protein